MPDTTRIHFQEELQQLEQQALGGLDLVVATLDRTLEALEQHDVELAGMIVEDDDRIDGRYLEVHQGVLSLLALQAPVATDLRLVAALLDVIKHFERMGDQCVNIAKLIPLAGHEPPAREEIVSRIMMMGRQASSQVSQAKHAFALRDVALAEDLPRQDEQINRLNREVFRLAIEVGDDGKGFDPDEESPNGNGELTEGGLGIAIIRSIVDDLELGPRDHGSGSRLRFVKRLARPE